jgi:uncharacterized membrane protein
MRVKDLLRWLLAAFMISAGMMHFLSPEPYVRIVPDYLPAALGLVYISGVFEILGGAGLLIPRLRRAAAWGLVALFVAVFPANVNMAIHRIPFFGNQAPPLFLWLRLPFQLVLIAWAAWYTRKEPEPS